MSLPMANVRPPSSSSTSHQVAPSVNFADSVIIPQLPSIPLSTPASYPPDSTPPQYSSAGIGEEGCSSGRGRGVVLACRHVFGISPDVRNNLHFVDDTQILYPAGQHSVIFSPDQKAQKFLSSHSEGGGCSEISSLTISPNRRFVAVAERYDDCAKVLVFDVVTNKLRRTLSFLEKETTKFVFLAFSSENKFLLTLGGPPSWSLHYWSWDKVKVVAQMNICHLPNVTANECSFNPRDSSFVCIIGDRLLRYYRLQEGQLKFVCTPLSKRENQQEYVCHTWLPDNRMIVCTQSGEILLFDSRGEFRMVLPSSPQEPHFLLCIAPLPKGFVCGGKDSTILLYERSDDAKEPFKKMLDMRVDNGQGVKVMGLATPPSENLLAVSLSNAQVYQLPLSVPALIKKEEPPTLQYLMTSFHQGAIHGLDVCIRRPIVVTCGADKTVRVWNFQEKTCELCKHFNEEAYSVAVHPSGFYLLVGFSDKLRLMTIVTDDLLTFREIPIKACRECRFAHGGHYFAAANLNTIQIYKTYYGDLVTYLRGHNSKVRSLSWTSDDSIVVSTGMDGAVYEYSIMQEGRRVSDWVQKGKNFSCVVVYTDPSTRNNTMYVVGNDGMVREIYDNQLGYGMDTGGTTLGQLALSNSARALFASVAEGEFPGSVRCYYFPLQGEFVEYKCHLKSSTRLRVTFDDQFLFSTSEDGTLFMFEIKEKDRTASKREKESVLKYADELLVTRLYMDDKQNQIQELERHVDEISNQMDFQLRNRDASHKDKIDVIENEYEQKIEEKRVKLEELAEKKKKLKMTFTENIQTLQKKNASDLQTLELRFERKLSQEVGRYHKLSLEKERVVKEFEEKIRTLHATYTSKCDSVEQTFKDQNSKLSTEIQSLVETKELMSKTHEETNRQLDEDVDEEIEDLKLRYEQQLALEREEKVHLMGQAGIHRKHHEDLQSIMDKIKEEISQKDEVMQHLRQDSEKIARERDAKAKEIKEKDKIIGEKEQRILDLKNQNEELEKYKFVLDHNVKALQETIDPKEKEIHEMKHHIQAMDGELENYHRKNKQLTLESNQLLLKNRGLQGEILNLRQEVIVHQTLVKRIKHDLHGCIQDFKDPRTLRDTLRVVYRKYVTQEIRTPEALDPDIGKEYTRQRDHLEKTVESLRRKLAKDSEAHRQDNIKLMQENASLIREINDLRREINQIKHEQNLEKLTIAQSTKTKKTLNRRHLLDKYASNSSVCVSSSSSSPFLPSASSSSTLISSAPPPPSITRQFTSAPTSSTNGHAIHLPLPDSLQKVKEAEDAEQPLISISSNKSFQSVGQLVQEENNGEMQNGK